MKKLALLMLLAGCKDQSVTPGPAAGKTAAPLTVSSPSFAEGASIAASHTCDGPDQSPQLGWTAAPDSAKSIAIVVDDPDAPGGTFTHWIIWNIKPDTRLLGAGGNGGFAGGISGTNDFDHVGYNGPCPPKGTVHHYRFTVYALDVLLALKSNEKRAALDKMMNGHIVAQGTLRGTYTH